MKYLNDYLLTLAYIRGERTVQSTTTAPRTVFIQNTLSEIYGSYRWPFATQFTNLTVASGVASLPTTFDDRHKLEAYFYSGTVQTPLDEIDPIDQERYAAGETKFWLESQSDGNYLLKTKDNISEVYVQFQKKPPIIAASVGAPIDEDMLVAAGANRYVKSSQDPNADISQDEALFQKRLTEKIASTQTSRPKRRIRKATDFNGYRFGGGYE